MKRVVFSKADFIDGYTYRIAYLYSSIIQINVE